MIVEGKIAEIYKRLDAENVNGRLEKSKHYNEDVSYLIHMIWDLESEISRLNGVMSGQLFSEDKKLLVNDLAEVLLKHSVNFSPVG